MDYVQSNKKDSGNDISLEKDLAEISVLEKKLQNAEDTIQELHNGLTKTKSSGLQMVIALKERDAEIIELKRQLEVSRNETGEANRLLESKMMLEDESKLLKERDHTIDKLGEELTKERTALQTKENAIKELWKEKKDLQKQLEDLKLNIEKLTREGQEKDQASEESVQTLRKELKKERTSLQAKENAIKELEKKNKDLDKELQHEQEITRHLIQTNLTVTTLHLLPYRHWDRLTGTKMLVSTIYVLILANQK